MTDEEVEEPEQSTTGPSRTAARQVSCTIDRKDSGDSYRWLLSDDSSRHGSPQVELDFSYDDAFDFAMHDD